VSYNFGEKTSDSKVDGDVTRLQNFLVSNSYLAKGNTTGYFGPLTLGAVKAFQLANGISPVVGYVGPLTRVKISEKGCGEVLGVSTKRFNSASTSTNAIISPNDQTIRTTLTANKTMFSVGDNITLTYRVDNRGTKPISYRFNSGCQAVVVAPAPLEGIVNRVCSMALSSFTIPAKSSKTFVINDRIATTSAASSSQMVTVMLANHNETRATTNIRVVSKISTVGETIIRDIGTEPASIELKNARVSLNIEQAKQAFIVAPTIVITAPSSGDVYVRKSLANFFLRMDKSSERGVGLSGFPLRSVRGATLQKVTYKEETPFSNAEVTEDVYRIKAGKKATFNFLPIKSNVKNSWVGTGYYDLVLTHVYLIKNGLNYDKELLLEDKKAKQVLFTMANG